MSILSTFNITTELRPLSKAPNPQLLPGRCSIGCPLLRVCVHYRVCVHLDGLNVEHKFLVLSPYLWIMIEVDTSIIYLFITSIVYSLKQ